MRAKDLRWARWAVILLIASAAQAQNVGPTDYTVPVSTAEQARLDATYKYAGQESDVLTNDATGTFLYNRFYNSLPFAYDFNVNVIGDTKRLPNGDQDNSLNALGNGGVRKYFSETGNAFYSGEVGIRYQDEFDRPSIVVIPGLGYGRFIRATTLARAVRIEDFLVDEGVISRRLPKDTIIELAHIIENEGEYEALHGERYRRYWFEAMEAEIAKSGVFTEEGLGAVGVLRTEEVLFEERINERFYGWDVRAGVRIEVLSEFEDVDADDPGASLRARYSRPLGWKSQFGVTGEADSPLTGDFGDAYNAAGTLDYIYEIGNRIDWTLSNVVLAAKSDPDADVVWSDQLSSGFLFYLENQVTLTIEANLNKVSDNPVTQGVDVSFGYRLR
jgi:hypothetical protein